MALVVCIQILLINGCCAQDQAAEAPLPPLQAGPTCGNASMAMASGMCSALSPDLKPWLGDVSTCESSQLHMCHVTCRFLP